MDYEKKYKEALGWMCKLYPGLHGATKEDAEHYFPELLESEDERIRKAILANYKGDYHIPVFNGVTREDCIAYLEKQKEQKPAEWNANDRAFIKDCARILDENFYTESAERLLSMFPVKPAEWSEEDDQLIGFIFDLLSSLVWRKEWAMDKKECLERLKSLRPVSKESLQSWKPSEWQMSMLLAVINDPNNAGSEPCYLTLKSIYEQLKKLL